MAGQGRTTGKSRVSEALQHLIVRPLNFNCPSLNFLKTEKLYAPLSYRGEEKEGFFDLQDWAEITVMSLGAGRRRRGRDPAFHLIGQLDKGGFDEMTAEPVPDGGSGKEILEKLRKASLKVGL